MQHSPYKIKYEQYFVMYSDRLKRRYYHYINKTYRIVIQ